MKIWLTSIKNIAIIKNNYYEDRKEKHMNNEDIQRLIIEFKRIAKKRFIESSSKGVGAIGLTFESELKKKQDSLYFPDYYGIEIKCTSRYSRYPISLFSISFDGPTFPEINRLIEKYGYPDKTFKDKKILFADLNFKKETLVDNKYIFKLEIDKNEQKLYLVVRDLKTNEIEKKSFVYLDSIYDHLNLKLKKMAIIYGSTKKEPNKELFRYYKIKIYGLISKEKFLDLLINGTIDVQLVARVHKSGNREGKYRNKNLIFQLPKDDITKLFKEIYVCDYDTNFERYY